MTRPSGDIAQSLLDARDGSNDALGEAFEACRHYLLGIANREMETGLNAKAGASDIVQDTFLEAQRDFSSFQGQSEDELLAWLRRLLLNNMANVRRHYRGTEKRKVDREVRLGGGDESQSEPPTDLAANAATPSVAMMADEQLNGLLNAMQKLPEDQQRILQLRYIEGLSFEAIGELMGRTSNAARKLWGRAVEGLQEIMDAAP